MARPRVLLVTHGRKHMNTHPGYSYLENNKSCFGHAVYLDINPETAPTYVLDVTENHMDTFQEQFDYVFCMCSPSWVLGSKQFWYNVEAWLAPGGIVQTVLPAKIRSKDFIFANKVSVRTGLRVMPKEPFMTRRIKAIVLKKDN